MAEFGRRALIRAGAAAGGAALVGGVSPPREAWANLGRELGGRLIKVEPSLSACLDDATDPSCTEALRDHQNPYFIQDQPAGYQTTGWFDAYTAEAGPYGVVARNAHDIAAAVRFARRHGVRLVVKNTGHDYLGRSSGRDALLLWTHHMRDITMHDAFRISAGRGSEPEVPAITVGAGTRWLEAYQAATADRRYVQGGGCTSVGAAGGFTLGGGFGTFSKRFGTAAGNLLEAEVVTADGKICVANRVRHPDLFWALRGGGGGTFGIVTKMTMRTYDIPHTVGLVAGALTAPDDAAYRTLIREFIQFFAANLVDPHWGEQIRFASDNTVQITMNTVDLEEAEARAIWKPFTTWLEDNGYGHELQFLAVPFQFLWDIEWWQANMPDFIRTDDRTTPPELFWWAANQGEVSQFLHTLQSRWLPIGMFEDPAADVLTDALFEASRIWPCTMHANKGLAGMTDEVRVRERGTSLNPVYRDAACLLMMGSEEQPAYPGVPGHGPDLAHAERAARQVDKAMGVIRDATPDSGAYANEADYFEPEWQHSFWADNYDRLLMIKKKYDPANLFRVHHGVGSEY